MRVTFVDNLLLARTGDRASVDLQPHLGLIALIAVLRERGHDARLFDPKVPLAKRELSLESHFYAALADRIVAGEPDVVGFTSLGCNFLCTLKIARHVRRLLPAAAILLGGPHATILDREILKRYPEFDAIARGEADLTIGPFIEALGGRHAIDTVDGVTYRKHGEAVRTRDGAPVLDLDALPFPAYDAYPVVELGLTRLRVDAGRGCPFSCTFCSTASFFGRRYRLKSAQRLVSELRRLEEAYGIHSFSLSHDLFTVNKEKVRAFCRAVQPYGYTWDCSARMDCVDGGLLAEMRESGCSGIYYGVETGSARMQRVVDKHLDLDLYHPTLAATIRAGMDATVSFITGYPEETTADQDETLELIGETIAQYPYAVDVQLHVIMPEPGTALLAAHAAELAYDGVATEFGFPILEPDDEELLRADLDVFVCHWYYRSGTERADTLDLAQAYVMLSSLGHGFIRALRQSDEPFAALLRSCGSFIRGRDRSDGLLAFVAGRRGDDDELTDAAQYGAALDRLRPDDRPRLTQIATNAPIELSRSVLCLEPVREAEELFRRLRASTSGTNPPLPRLPRLLFSTDDLRARRTLAVDATTAAIVDALSKRTTFELLAERFGRATLEPRLAVLCLLGALVRADAEGAAWNEEIHDVMLPLSARRF
jgi:radical SAM superfamily enzyme YgiQ (UPF0313 family)